MDQAKLRRKFEAINTNKDGFITREEIEFYSCGVLENEFESIMGRAVNWREIFSILDSDNDGKISYADFLAGATDKATLLNEDSLRMAFNVIDRDGDGIVSIDDLKWRFSYTNFEGMPDL